MGGGSHKRIQVINIPDIQEPIVATGLILPRWLRFCILRSMGERVREREERQQANEAAAQQGCPVDPIELCNARFSSCWENTTREREERRQARALSTQGNATK